MVCIKAQAGEEWALSMHQCSGTMVGQEGNKVWDACSTEKSGTSYILPVVTPPELGKEQLSSLELLFCLLSL